MYKSAGRFSQRSTRSSYVIEQRGPRDPRLKWAKKRAKRLHDRRWKTIVWDDLSLADQQWLAELPGATREMINRHLAAVSPKLRVEIFERYRDRYRRRR